MLDLSAISMFREQKLRSRQRRLRFRSLKLQREQSIHLLSVLIGQQPNALVQELEHAEQPFRLHLLKCRPVFHPNFFEDVPTSDGRNGSLQQQPRGSGSRLRIYFLVFQSRLRLDSAARSLGNLTDSGSGFWSVVPGVSLPIFNRGRIRNNIGVQNAREEQALIVV